MKGNLTVRDCSKNKSLLISRNAFRICWNQGLYVITLQRTSASVTHLVDVDVIGF